MLYLNLNNYLKNFFMRFIDARFNLLMKTCFKKNCHCVKRIQIRSFPHSHWIRRDTPYLSVLTPNAGKNGPEKLWIQTLFLQFVCSGFNHALQLDFSKIVIVSEMQINYLCTKSFKLDRIGSPLDFQLFSLSQWLFYWLSNSVNNFSMPLRQTCNNHMNQS